MPPAEEIQRQIFGAWRLMNGKRDGARLLDSSVDGFWNSFFAIVLSLPVMIVGWVPIANDALGADSTVGQRLSYAALVGLSDIGAWVLPIAALAFVAGLAGIRDRFIPYIVASNWGSVLFAWLMLPASLLRLLWPASGDAVIALSLGIFFTTLVLSWRLTNAVLDKGAAVASGVFAAMLIASIFTLFTLQSLFGLMPAQ